MSTDVAMSSRGDYERLNYIVEVEDISDDPPYRNLQVEMWESPDETGEYPFRAVYSVTKLSGDQYQVEDISDDVYGKSEEERVLTRASGDIQILDIGENNKELQDFAEEIIDVLDPKNT